MDTKIEIKNDAGVNILFNGIDDIFYTIVIATILNIIARISPIIIAGTEYNRAYVIKTPITPFLSSPIILYIPNSYVLVSTDIISSE